MCYVFEECTLDTQQDTLHRALHTIRQPSEFFQVFVYLLTHRCCGIVKHECCKQALLDQSIDKIALAGVMKDVSK